MAWRLKRPGRPPRVRAGKHPEHAVFTRIEKAHACMYRHRRRYLPGDAHAHKTTRETLPL
jgi:hypothetical protein